MPSNFSIPATERSALILFARNPELGKVKTRLAKTLGDEAALEVYKQLLLHTQQVTQSLEADKYVFFAEAFDASNFNIWNGYEIREQVPGDLGNRMLHAFQTLFQSNYNKLIIIGSDCPDLTTAIIQEAYAALDTADAVIGPSKDGGYYLLGMKQLLPSLFSNKSWSTEIVMAQTVEALKNAGYSYSLLTALQDVDEEKDLPATYRQLIKPY